MYWSFLNPYVLGTNILAKLIAGIQLKQHLKKMLLDFCGYVLQYICLIMDLCWDMGEIPSKMSKGRYYVNKEYPLMKLSFMGRRRVTMS